MLIVGDGIRNTDVHILQPVLVPIKFPQVFLDYTENIIHLQFLAPIMP